MTMQLPAPRLRAQRGFSLAELMIAAALSLAIMAGMTTLLVNSSKAQGEVEKSNRQIENGRFSAQLLSSDLANAGFYGEFDPTVLTSPASLPDPCLTTLAALNAALPLPVQGYDNVASNVLSCLSDVRAGTDIVVLRHTSTCVAGVGNCDPVSAGGAFFQASLCNNASELNSEDTSNFYALGTSTGTLLRHKRNCTSIADIRRFETHIYFVANNDNSGDAIPTLKRAELATVAGSLVLSIVPLVEGIENLQLEYGVDQVVDGRADVFTASPGTLGGCSDAACAVDNWRKVVAVKLNLLARNIEPTSSHTDSKSYVLGFKANGSANEIAAANDHYKRHVFQAVVGLPNPAGRNTQ
jgi:type IV pilus assembly protein PilW